MCKKDVESFEHLFWQCEYAKKIWSAITCWWGISNKVYIEGLGSMWNSASFFKNSSIRKVWLMVIASCIWTIWPDRNQCDFYNDKFNLERVILLVITRSLEWCSALNLIFSETVKWWKMNPMGSVTRSIDLQLKKLMDNDCVLTSFIDGCWKSFSKGKILSGAGGIVKMKQGEKNSRVC